MYTLCARTQSMHLCSKIIAAPLRQLQGKATICSLSRLHFSALVRANTIATTGHRAILSSDRKYQGSHWCCHDMLTC